MTDENGASSANSPHALHLPKPENTNEEPALYELHHSSKISADEYLVIDSDLEAAGPQNTPTVIDIETGEYVGFAVYVTGVDSLRTFEIDIKWDHTKASMSSSRSGLHIPDDDMNINGKSDAVFAPEKNILAVDGGQISSIPGSNDPGHYSNVCAKLGGEPATQSEGLLYLAVFRITDSFSGDEELIVQVAVSLFDDHGSEIILAPQQFSVFPAFPVNPPHGLMARDIPNDNGHRIELVWNVSPDDSVLSYYNIYRSLNPSFSDPVDPDQFLTIEDVIDAEMTHALLIARVPPGTSSYVDSYVPLNGVMYYYWVEAVCETGSSEKVQAGFPVMVETKPMDFRVNAPYPNPFNPETTISFSISGECRISVAIYDLLGRKIAVLAEEILPAGRHSIVWDGRDSKGGQVGSGVYCYRVTAGNNIYNGKITCLR